MRKSTLMMNTAAVLLVGLVAGCAGSGTKDTASGPASAKPEGNSPAAATAKPEPVTVKIAANKAVLTADEIKLYITEPLAKKYPHITVEMIDTAEKGKTLTDLVAAKEIPDIYANFPLNLNELVDLKLASNMEELIKTYKFDLSRVQPEFVESIKIGSSLDYLAGLPMFNQTFALFYNKDLFGRMAVPFPKDGMTWEQARDLAVKMTRTEGGVQYWGFWPDGVYRGAYQASLPWADFKSNKAVFQTEGWKDLFNMWYDLYKVPGYAPKGTNYTKEFNEGRLAMMSGSTSTLKNMLAVKDLNWDVVTYPQNSKAPGVGQRVDSFVLAVTSQSKQKEAAFRVIEVILSDEVQTLMSRNARLSVLKDAKIQGEFGKNIAEYQSKNVIAFTKPKLAILQTFKNLPAVTIINQSFDSMLYEGKDVNTALREADEKMNQEIQKLLSK
ncbi:extracellular solute-binding protein [Paenibacillus mesophilus]|uniref:ABC transporter substrate-binding protein n=1 Tax=Paenibacillus mesophilus TaxID=2582849 RepID=UPI00110EC319|nr:extracellular solute-binding protein [Paenibacillus mesophilus]TMV45501.1 extracellular solute-binding protein [Paenibacillus mesophilus]